MGYGYNLKCESCNYYERFLLGEGMLTPSLVIEALDKIEKGEYGPDMQEIVKGDDVAACGFYDFCVCSDCGELHSAFVVEVYQTKDGKPMPEKVISPADTDAYELLMKLPLTCKKCGGPLRAAEGLSKTPCPRCGGKIVKSGGMIMWD